MEEILVPIFVCVVLPVAIVLITALSKMNADNKRSQVLIKAIESNCGIDADKLAEALSKPKETAPKKTAREILNLRLLRGCIFTLIGIALLAVEIYNYATLEPNMDNDSGTIPSIFGGASLAIGISYLIVYFATRKQIDKPEDK